VSGVALLPLAALQAWRAAEAGGSDATAARWLVTGADLSRVLVSVGLATPEDLAECVIAQCAAPAITDGLLRWRIDGDLYALADLAGRDTLARLSSALVGTWLDACNAADSVHVAHAESLLSAAQPGACERALERVRWHLPVLRFLKQHFDVLSAPMRGALATGIEIRLRRWFPPVLQVEPFADLAVLTRDGGWLERAEAVLEALTASDLEPDPHRVHPVISIARAEAALGRTDVALSRVRELPGAQERWAGLVELVEASPPLFEPLEQELMDLREQLELSWWTVLAYLPGLGPRWLEAIRRAPAHERVDALCAVAPHVDPADGREALREALAGVEAMGTTLASSELVEAWSNLLTILDTCGARDLVGAERRAWLLDEWRALGQPHDLADLVAPFIPDAAANEVLADAEAHLRGTSRWEERESWLELGMQVCPRADTDCRARWMTAAAEALPLVPVDHLDAEALAPFAEEVRRGIVLAALARTQAWLSERARDPH
jgi:hypothetical protein